MAYAAVLGMIDDLDLRGQEYSLLGSVFYLGYLLMEFPTAWILTRWPIGKYASALMILWGGCLCTMAACTSFAGAVTVRFFLGILEAGILPACIVFTAEWYRRSEQPLRTALWFCPFSGIFGGILAYAIGHIQAGLAVWRLLFLIYGGATIVIGIILWLALPDSYETAWFLSDEECEEAKLRTIENQTGVDMRKGWKSAHVVETLRDPKYWVIAVFGICQSITNAGIINVVQSSDPVWIRLLERKDRAAGIPSRARCPRRSDCCVDNGPIYPEHTLHIMVPVLYSGAYRGHHDTRFVESLSPKLSLFEQPISNNVPVIDANKHRITVLMGLYLTGFYNVSWVMAMSLISSNVAGATKKSFGSVSVGNMIGPQFFLDSQKPHYQSGISAMISSFCIMAACGILYR
ncbi:MAG: hypothetical protein M1834_005618 [Cirrosporium novae-zelandiae]|nr:MAG: hypothetical protein M1834_005618 [Cirrosporium novae-zelandiae]